MILGGKEWCYCWSVTLEGLTVGPLELGMADGELVGVVGRCDDGETVGRRVG